MNGNSLTYNTILNPDGAITEAIDRGLDAHNRAALGAYDYTRIAITVRDADGTIIGGIYGDLLWDYFYIQTLWVDERYRGQDIGSRLLAQAEAVAAEHGITQAHLETTSFQALAFYRKHGYVVFGELPNKPAGHTWYFLRKEFENHS